MNFLFIQIIGGAFALYWGYRGPQAYPWTVIPATAAGYTVLQLFWPSSKNLRTLGGIVFIFLTTLAVLGIPYLVGKGLAMIFK